MNEIAITVSHVERQSQSIEISILDKNNHHYSQRALACCSLQVPLHDIKGMGVEGANVMLHRLAAAQTLVECL